MDPFNNNDDFKKYQSMLLRLKSLSINIRNTLNLPSVKCGIHKIEDVIDISLLWEAKDLCRQILIYAKMPVFTEYIKKQIKFYEELIDKTIATRNEKMNKKVIN